eukprot:1938823-Karenia_brevis.AAC.1
MLRPSGPFIFPPKGPGPGPRRPKESPRRPKKAQKQSQIGSNRATQRTQPDRCCNEVQNIDIHARAARNTMQYN